MFLKYFYYQLASSAVRKFRDKNINLINSINTSGVEHGEVCNSHANHLTNGAFQFNAKEICWKQVLKGRGVIATSACSSWLDLCGTPGARHAEDSGKHVWDLAVIRSVSAAGGRNRRRLPWRCGKRPARWPLNFWTCTQRRQQRRSALPEKCPR